MPFLLIYTLSDDRTARVWRVSGGDDVSTTSIVLRGFHTSRIFRSAVVSPVTVVTAGEDGAVGVWDVTSPDAAKLTSKLRHGDCPIWCLAVVTKTVSDDHRLLVYTGGGDGAVKQHDVTFCDGNSDSGSEYKKIYNHFTTTGV